MPMFIGSQSFISLPSFMFVSAVVSEIRELKKKEKEKKEEKNSEIDYFQFNTFLGHIIYPFFNQRYLLSTCTDSPTPQTESDHQDFLKYTIMLAKPGPSLYTQYYRTV